MTAPTNNHACRGKGKTVFQSYYRFCNAKETCREDVLTHQQLQVNHSHTNPTGEPTNSLSFN